jgi:hypothetical protein
MQQNFWRDEGTGFKSTGNKTPSIKNKFWKHCRNKQKENYQYPRAKSELGYVDVKYAAADWVLFYLAVVK